MRKGKKTWMKLRAYTTAHSIGKKVRVFRDSRGRTNSSILAMLLCGWKLECHNEKVFFSSPYPIVTFFTFCRFMIMLKAACRHYSPAYIFVYQLKIVESFNHRFVQKNVTIIICCCLFVFKLENSYCCMRIFFKSMNRYRDSRRHMKMICMRIDCLYIHCQDVNKEKMPT